MSLASWIRRILGRRKPVVIPFPPQPPPDPPKPPKPQLLFGVYFEDALKYGDYSDAVRAHAPLYVCLNGEGYQRSSDEDPSLYFPEMRARLARECGLYGRRLLFQLNVDRDGILVRKSLTCLQPYADKLIGVILADEPDWPEQATRYRVEQVRAEMETLGLGAPIGITVSEEQALTGTGHHADGIDFVGVELYVEPRWQNDPQGAVDEMRRKAILYRAAVPGTKKLLYIIQAFDRNGNWKNAESLAALQWPSYQEAANDPRALGLLAFAYGRKGGIRDHPELGVELERIGAAIREQ